MDLKSIVLNKRVKFFLNITPISSYLSLNLVYPFDALNTLEPSHLLFFQYSKLHNQQPRNVDPNTSSLTRGTLAARVERNDLSFFCQNTYTQRWWILYMNMILTFNSL